MKTTLRRLLATVAVVAVSALAAGAAVAQGAGNAKIIVVTHGQASDPFWSVVKNGVDAAQKEYGASVEYRAPDTFDMVKMAQLIDSAIASQPTGLVVSIADPVALGDSIKNAVASGIAVVSMNSGSDSYKSLGVSAHVGQTEFEAGQGGGERMAAAGVKKAVCVNQEVGNVSLDTRCEGFAKGLGGQVKVLAVNLTDPTGTASAIKAHFSAEPDTQGMITLGPSAAEPALEALNELGMLGKVKFGTFDLSPSVLQAVRDGKMEFAIDQQQYLQGYLPVAMLVLNQRYGLMPAGVVMTGPGFVTKQNAAQVIELSKQGIR
jgi:simple sugar transport system substrate-binding protein